MTIQVGHLDKGREREREEREILVHACMCGGKDSKIIKLHVQCVLETCANLPKQTSQKCNLLIMALQYTAYLVFVE